MSFILEVCVFGGFSLSCLHLFVVSTTWHMTIHLFVLVGEAQRKLWLLASALHLGPLGVFDCLDSLVSTWTRLVWFRNRPLGCSLGCLWLSDRGWESFGFSDRGPSIVVLVSGGHFRGQPLAVVCKVSSLVFVVVISKHLHLFLACFEVVVLAGCRLRLLKLHDFVSESLSWLLEELSNAPWYVVFPVSVLQFGPRNELELLCMDIEETFDFLLIGRISHRDTVLGIYFRRAIEVVSKRVTVFCAGYASNCESCLSKGLVVVDWKGATLLGRVVYTWDIWVLFPGGHGERLVSWRGLPWRLRSLKPHRLNGTIKR